MKKFLKITGWILTILMIIVLILFIRPAWTPFIKSAHGKKAVASLERIELGGLKQYILIRSADISNPVLLFIHGGPGMPLMYLSHTFQRPLEKHYTVVQWDQRGAGKSYRPDIPVETINVEQYLNDALQLIDTLRQRYHQSRIFLVGHSWGTYISSILVQRHPELFNAYISVGQVVDGDAAHVIQREFLLSAAKSRNDTAAFARLQQPGFNAFENYLFLYGGELKHHSSFAPLVITGLMSTEYTFRDAMNVAKGPPFCNAHMQYNAIPGKIRETIRQYEIPVYFLTGSHDYTTPFPLIQEYYDSIQAPLKKMIWFNESAHFPFYEEPQKFDSVLIYQVLHDHIWQ